MSTVSIPSIKRSSLLRSTSLVSLMTMLSRVMGFVRDAIIAQLFGAVAGIDAFFVAFKIPNFMRRLFAEGAFSQAFVPVLGSYQETESEARLKLFLARIAGNLFVILMALTVVAIVVSPFIIRVFAPGFEKEGPRFLLASSMLKITFPYLMLISLTALSGAVLNTFGRFGIPAFTPVLLNISMIIAAVYFAPMFAEPVNALAWGVLIAGFVQLFFQLPFLYRSGLFVMPQFCWHDSGVKRVLKLMVPALFGVSVAQINLLLDTVFASFLPVGSVSWLYYSDRLTFFPLGVFGVAISTVVLPHLSRDFASKDEQLYSQTLDWGMRLVLLIAIPSTLGLVICAKPILASLLAYGKFNAHDVSMTQKSLVTFSLGITAFMLVKILGSAFYATQNIKTPVKVGVIAMFCNTLLCLIFIQPLAHAGLALASSLSGFLNASVLIYLLVKRNIYRPAAGWFGFMWQLFLSNAALVTLLYFCAYQFDWLAMPAWLRLVSLFSLILAAMVLYFVCLFITGFQFRLLRGPRVIQKAKSHP